MCKSYNLIWVVVYFSSVLFTQFETLVFTSVTSLNSETAAATASRSLPHQSTELSSALLDWLFILHAFELSWSTQLHADRMINNMVCKRFWIQTAEVRWQEKKDDSRQTALPQPQIYIHPQSNTNCMSNRTERFLASKRTLVWQAVNLHSVLLVLNPSTAFSDPTVFVPANSPPTYFLWKVWSCTEKTLKLKLLKSLNNLISFYLEYNLNSYCAAGGAERGAAAGEEGQGGGEEDARRRDEGERRGGGTETEPG